MSIRILTKTELYSIVYACKVKFTKCKFTRSYFLPFVHYDQVFSTDISCLSSKRRLQFLLHSPFLKGFLSHLSSLSKMLVILVQTTVGVNAGLPGNRQKTSNLEKKIIQISKRH